MPRQPRLDYPGALHHVIGRGIERRAIFIDEADRRCFLDRLGKVIERSRSTLYAWSLLDNHFHLLVRTGSEPLSSLMRRLMTGHAVTFNRRHRRAGHLFQNRFKNILVEEEPYLLELVRYIHLNPVRSRLPVTVENLDRYPWTGHAVLLGHRAFAAQDTDLVLERFGRKVGHARRACVQFVREGATRTRVPDLDGAGLWRSAGGWGSELVPTLRRGRERWAYDERVLGSIPGTSMIPGPTQK